jgi:hypothetical protein
MQMRQRGQQKVVAAQEDRRAPSSSERHLAQYDHPLWTKPLLLKGNTLGHSEQMVGGNLTSFPPTVRVVTVALAAVESIEVKGGSDTAATPII